LVVNFVKILSIVYYVLIITIYMSNMTIYMTQMQIQPQVQPEMNIMNSYIYMKNVENVPQDVNIVKKKHIVLDVKLVLT